MKGFIYFVRYGIPALFITVGFIVLFTVEESGHAWTGWAGFTGAGLSVLLLNVLHRMGHHSHLDREVDDAAREHFDKHGRWPDDAALHHFEKHRRWPDE